MKRVGSVLMLVGAGIGVVAAVGIGGGFHLAFPWLVNVALAKLTLVASGSVMAAGAVVRRIAVRNEQANLLSAGTDRTTALTGGRDDER